MKKILLLVALLYLVPSAQPSLAWVALSPHDPETCALEGQIQASDEADLNKVISNGCGYLYLESLGGNLYAAMSMGRKIRKAKMMTLVRGDNKGHNTCASACVFLYAAGVQRVPFGKVVIHRPYIETSGLSLSETNVRFSKMAQDVERYLQEIGVNADLYRRMMSIPPEKAEELTGQELDLLGLGRWDPVFYDYKIGVWASRRGLTKQEYLTMKSRAHSICGANPADGFILVRDSKRSLACWDREFYDLLPESRGVKGIEKAKPYERW